MVFISERQKLEEALQFIQKGNSAQIDDGAFVSELRDWIRFNPASALKTGDGLLGMCAGSPSAPDWLGPTIFGLAFKKGSENKKLARQIRSSAGIAVFVAEQEGPEGWIAVGRSFERFALQGTALGIRHSHVNMPIEVPAVRPAFADWQKQDYRLRDDVYKECARMMLYLGIERGFKRMADAAMWIALLFLLFVLLAGLGGCTHERNGPPGRHYIDFASRPPNAT